MTATTALILLTGVVTIIIPGLFLVWLWIITKMQKEKD